MLILAGVSINAIVGENGILNKAQYAKTVYEESALWEKIQAVLFDAYSNGLTKQELVDYCNQQFEAQNIEARMQLYGDGYAIVYGKNPEKLAILDSNNNVIDSTAQVLGSGYEYGSEASEGDWIYSVNDDGTTVTIIGYSASSISGKVIIPNFINGYVVTGLGDGVFSYCSGITSVDFSAVKNILTSIGEGCFEYCQSMVMIVPDDLPSSLENVGDRAFSNCDLIEGNITSIINSNITLGKGVFMRCKKLTGDIQQVFNQNFFMDGGIPTATVIEDNQFNGYSGLTGSLTIPSYITSIGKNAFYGCSSFSELYFENTNDLQIIDDYAFYQCSNISNNVNIPNSVVYVGDYCFYECVSMSGISLPSNLGKDIMNGEEILVEGDLGIYAFYGNTKMNSNITLPSYLTIIPENSFYKSGITGINFLQDLEGGCVQIGANAFQFCNDLTTVSCNNVAGKFPTTLLNIGANAFAFDFKFTGNITLPDSLTTLGSASFKNTDIDIIKWSPKLTAIPNACFWECHSLTRLPDSTKLISIADQAFLSCEKLGYNNGTGTSLIEYLNNSIIANVNQSAFYMCSYLKGSRTGDGNIKNSKNINIVLNGSPFAGTNVVYEGTISTTTTSIATKEFLGVSNFKNCITMEGTDRVLTLPSNIQTIGSYAFSGCSGFEKLVIPNSVTTISSYAFANMADVKVIEFESNSKVTVLPNDCFRATMTLEKIVFPDKLVTIGERALFDTYAMGPIVIPDTVEEIKTSAFAWCGYNGGLTSIHLSTNLKTIGDTAFKGNCWVQEIVIPDSVTSLGTSAFDGNFAAKTITIGSGVADIPQECFSLESISCWKNRDIQCEKVIIRGTIKTIGMKAFAEHAKLTTIEGLQWNTVDKIGDFAFYNCQALQTNGKLNSSCIIGRDAFLNCLTYPIR